MPVDNSLHLVFGRMIEFEVEGVDKSREEMIRDGDCIVDISTTIRVLDSNEPIRGNLKLTSSKQIMKSFKSCVITFSFSFQESLRTELMITTYCGLDLLIEFFSKPISECVASLQVLSQHLQLTVCAHY